MTARSSLDEIARHHGTDKSTAGHGFTVVYDPLLSEWREHPVKILEIGVYKGASLRMWQDYFPLGRIVGIDKAPATKKYVSDRVEVYIGHQTDRALLEKVTDAEGPFDLIIDDGEHTAVPQKLCLKWLWPHLKAGGIYVIEDIHTSYMKEYHMGWREPGTTVEFLKYVVDDINVKFHRQVVTLPDIESIHFYSELFLMHRASVT